MENYPAYDFDGTAPDGRAYPYDTTQLTDGQHEIKAVIELASVGTEEVTALFEVNN